MPSLDLTGTHHRGFLKRRHVHLSYRFFISESFR